MNKKGQSDFFGTIVLIGAIIFVLFISGILGAMTYFTLGQMNSTIQTINFSIPYSNNSSVQSFQDIADIVIYPILGLRNSIVYLTYILAFALILAFAMFAFLVQRHPVYYIPYLIVVILFSGLAIPIANSYETMLQDPVFLSMMAEFVIYSKIMLYLPQFIFFTGLLFAGIGAIGIIKSRNTQSPYEQINF